jgi:hypothetical protein
MKYCDWDRLRGKLNHNWLPKSFISFLKAEKDALNDPSLLKNDIVAVLDQLQVWKTKQSSLLKFIKNAEEALSPRQLLDEHPLKNLSKEDRVWLGKVVHALYLRESGIKKKIKKLRNAILAVDGLVAFTTTRLKGEQICCPGNCGDDLLEKVIELSALISALPHAIHVPHGVL